MKKLFAFLFLTLSLVGCVSDTERNERRFEAEKRAQNDRAFAALSAEDFAICEAVFRYQFAHNASSAQGGAQAYFVEIYGNDPSPEFIGRFRDHVPTVKIGSAFKVGRGLHFRISAITIDGTTAEVSGGYYEGSLSSSGNTYFLEKKNSVWSVVRDEMQWISALHNPESSVSAKPETGLVLNKPSNRDER